jgi:hypothetical protein
MGEGCRWNLLEFVMNFVSILLKVSFEAFLGDFLLRRLAEIASEFFNFSLAVSPKGLR